MSNVAFFQQNNQFIQFQDTGQMDKQEPVFILNKPKWNWVKIDSDLKTKVDGKNQKIALKSTMAFQGRDQAGQVTRLQPRVVVDTEKSLQYENEVGWNWHKSSNLPIISVKFEIKVEDSEQLLGAPQGLEIIQAQVFAVKIIVNTLQRDQVAYLEDVGIRGKNKIDLKDGCGLFSGIRFLSTSYNNEGVKFYLLIVVKSKVQETPFDSIVCSLLSPPIFVDSRKSARDYQEKKFMSFVELFHPELFSKDFTKRETKTKSDMEIKIVNNLEGLFNYLTAPNIRHKVKHPLFLSVKFSNVFKIMYNSNHDYFQKEGLTVADLLRKLQKKLIKEIGRQKKTKKVEQEHQKPFLISLIGQCSTHKKSKIYDCLEYLDCRAIDLVQYQYQIASEYLNINELGDVVAAYSEIYQQLDKISNRQISSRKNKEQEQVAESICRDQLLESDDQEENRQNNVKVEDPGAENPHLNLPSGNRVASQKYEENFADNVKKCNSNKERKRRTPDEEDFDQEDQDNEKQSHNELKKGQEDFQKRKSNFIRRKVHHQDDFYSDHQTNLKMRRRVKQEELMEPMRKMRVAERNNSKIVMPIIQDQILHQESNLMDGQAAASLHESFINEILEQNILQSMASNPASILPMGAVMNPILTQMAGEHLLKQQSLHHQQNMQQKAMELMDQFQAMEKPEGHKGMENNFHQQQQAIRAQQNEASIDEQHKISIKNEIMAHLEIQNNFLRDMIISNEVLKGKVEMLFQMNSNGLSGSGSQPITSHRSASNNFMQDNLHRQQQANYHHHNNYHQEFMQQEHQKQYNKEQQHQAQLVQMAQNFQAHMQEMAQGMHTEAQAQKSKQSSDKPIRVTDQDQYDQVGQPKIQE